MRDRPATQVAKPAVAVPPLVVRDLLADLAQVIGWLQESLAGRDSLDAYLLAAGAAQIVEDYQHRDVWSVRRIAVAVTRYRCGSGLAWLLCLPATVADLLRRLSRRDRRLTRWLSLLADVRNQLAFSVLRASAGIQCDLSLLMLQIGQLRAELPLLPAGVRHEPLRLPSCFRSFDQRPADCAQLAAIFTSRTEPVPVLVLGVRTSGGYLAPLVAAALADEMPTVEIVTMRPSRPLRPAERAVVDRTIRRGGHILVVDDPPVSGEALGEVIGELGVPTDLVTLLVASFNRELPESLRHYQTVMLPFDDWAVHAQLRPAAVHAALTALIGPGVRRVQRLASPGKDDNPDNRGHVSALYRVEVEQSGGLLVMVSGTGLGYFGRHALAVTQAVRAFVPQVYGFRDGLVFREWLPEAHRLDALTPDLADRIAAYVCARAAALPTSVDRSRDLAGRAPVWEVASMLIAHAFGRLGLALRPLLLDRAVRRLTAVSTPSIVDGDTGLHTWFFDGFSARTINPDVRAFSNRDLACYDPAYDVAGIDPGGRYSHGTAVRRCYEARIGRPVDDERMLLYELVHVWNRARNGHVTDSQSRRACSRAVQRYLAACYLGDLPQLCDGPIVALDCDGVLETDPLGYPAATPAGVLSLRGLQAHGYQPVLVTGRSLDEVAERCENYHLAGGVAEYGSVSYRHADAQVIELVTPQQRVALHAVRRSLAAAPGVQLDTDYSYIARAFCTDSRGRRHGLSEDIVTKVLKRAGQPAVYVISGQGQTDFVATGIDKGRGLETLTCQLGSSTIALAVGDSSADPPMLRLARTAYLPANASVDARAAGAVRLRQPYQAGLSVAVARLTGHRPGTCPSCRPGALSRESRLLLAVLAAPQAGRRGLLGHVGKTVLACSRADQR